METSFEVGFTEKLNYIFNPLQDTSLIYVGTCWLLWNLESESKWCEWHWKSVQSMYTLSVKNAANCSWKTAMEWTEFSSAFILGRNSWFFSVLNTDEILSWKKKSNMHFPTLFIMVLSIISVNLNTKSKAEGHQYDSCLGRRTHNFLVSWLARNVWICHIWT